MRRCLPKIFDPTPMHRHRLDSAKSNKAALFPRTKHRRGTREIRSRFSRRCRHLVRHGNPTLILLDGRDLTRLSHIGPESPLHRLRGPCPQVRPCRRSQRDRFRPISQRKFAARIVWALTGRRSSGMGTGASLGERNRTGGPRMIGQAREIRRTRRAPRPVPNPENPLPECPANAESDAPSASAPVPVAEGRPTSSPATEASLIVRTDPPPVIVNNSSDVASGASCRFAVDRAEVRTQRAEVAHGTHMSAPMLELHRMAHGDPLFNTMIARRGK